MDLLDEAKELEMAARERAIANHLANIKEPPQDIENGVVYCVGCAVVIAQERLLAKPNAARCVDCQLTHEHKERR